MPINLYKPVGMTPLEAINAFRRENSEYKNKKMSYAGRLDPIAEGVLIVLVGEETKKQKEYQNLDKEYEAEMLFGFSSDSYDVLGIVNRENFEQHKPETEGPEPELLSFFNQELNGLKGKTNLPVPPHSSYEIKGKPLFWWTRKGRLEEVKIPKKEMDFRKIEIKEIKKLNNGEILESITNKVGKVKGDFRQEKILQKWKEALVDSEKKSILLTLKIYCSSGTYVRSLAHELGKKTGKGAVLYGLKRTKAGSFSLKDSIVVKY